MACEETHFTVGKKLPALNFLFPSQSRGRWEKLLYLIAIKDLIDASSTSPEVLIVTWYKQWGWKWEQFTHGKQIPVCQSFIFCEQRGRRGNVALFYNKLRADLSFQPIARNAHSSLIRSVGMEKRVFYPRQTNACLLIFCFL